MKVQIWISDYKDAEKIKEENERNLNLGLPVIPSEKRMKLVDFHFVESHLGAFWCDPDIDDDSKTYDIIFYIDGNSYRTPWRKETEELFKTIITPLIY